MPTKCTVVLSPADRAELERITKSGSALARVICRANALLLSDTAPPREGLPDGGPGMPDNAIAEALRCNPITVARTRRRYLDGGLAAVVRARKPAPSRPRAIDQAAEAHLIALACSEAPEGREVWTVRLLRDRFVELGREAGWIDGDVSHETIRQTLKKTNFDLTARRRT